jgi:hypothetical protein
MAEAFNPNAFYDYSYSYRHDGSTIKKHLKVRASDGMIRVPSTGRGDRYYKGLDEFMAKGGGYYNPDYKAKPIGYGYTKSQARSGPAQRAAVKSAFTEGEARYGVYKTSVASHEAAAARARGAALSKQMGKKAAGIAERRQLKKPEIGKPKVRKGAKLGGVAALKKPIAGVAI